MEGELRQRRVRAPPARGASISASGAAGAEERRRRDANSTISSTSSQPARRAAAGRAASVAVALAWISGPDISSEPPSGPGGRPADRRGRADDHDLAARLAGRDASEQTSEKRWRSVPGRPAKSIGSVEPGRWRRDVVPGCGSAVATAKLGSPLNERATRRTTPSESSVSSTSPTRTPSCAGRPSPPRSRVLAAGPDFGRGEHDLAARASDRFDQRVVVGRVGFAG